MLGHTAQRRWGGAADLARFSANHDITSGEAWTAALVLMALGEVVCRTATLWIRAQRALAEQPKVLVAA